MIMPNYVHRTAARFSVRIPSERGAGQNREGMSYSYESHININIVVHLVVTGLVSECVR